MNRLKEISLFILIGIITTSIAYAIDSIIVFTYLQQNIIGLLLTLLAINTATSGLIVSKIQDILIEFPELDFSITLREMKMSLVEQIILIVLALIALLILDSKVIDFQCKMKICNSVLVSVFAYAIYALWDTGQSIFILVDEINKLRKK